METICVVSLEGLSESPKMTISTATSSEVIAGDIMPPSGDAPVENGNYLKLSEPLRQETGGRFTQIQRQQEETGAVEVDQQSCGSTRGFSELNCVSSSGSLCHSPDEGEHEFRTQMHQNGPEHIPLPVNTDSSSPDVTEKDTEEPNAILVANSWPTVESGHNFRHSNMEDPRLTGVVPDVSQHGGLSAHPTAGLNGHDVNVWPHTQSPRPVPSLVVILDQSVTLSDLPSKAPALDTGQGLDLPRIIKHKPSSITFADYDCPPCERQQQSALANESSDGQESSSEDDTNDAGGDDEDEDENDEDVFPELPLSMEFLAAQQRRNRERPRRRGAVAESTSSPVDLSSGTKAEDDTSSTRELPQVLSPWSESMSQLMMKLDQLNLDIEDALSAGSSPSDTPAATRRHTTGHNNPQLMSTKRRNKGTEIEAKEACDWLRAAGFPQYAQLFEDSQFPIDISPVKKDHDFLDKDLVEPLCRRLNTLNKCASMKLDVNLPKKKCEDSDEDDLVAISDKWTFEHSSRRWSRLQDIDRLLGPGESLRGGGGGGPGELGLALRTTTSSESVLTDLSEPEVSSLHSESSGHSGHHHHHHHHHQHHHHHTRGTHSAAEDSDSSRRTCSDSAATTTMPDPTSLALPRGMALPADAGHSYGSLPSKGGKRARVKDFVRRMENLRSRGGNSGSGRRPPIISGPVLQQEPKTLRTLRCVEIVNGDAAGRAPDSAPRIPTLTVVPCPSSSEGSSSQSSGSAVSTPSMKERRPHRHGSDGGGGGGGGGCRAEADSRRGGLYLEDAVDALVEHNRRNEFRSYEDLVVHIPKDHKPGTFPKALSIESLSPTTTTTASTTTTTSTSLHNVAGGDWHSLGRASPDGPLPPPPPQQRLPSLREPRPVTQCCTRGSRISVYDNVPGSHLYASTGDLMDLEKEEDLFPHLDDILQHVSGLQQIVDHWTKNVLPGGEEAADDDDDDDDDDDRDGGGGREGDGEEGAEGEMPDLQSSSQITLDFEANSVLEGQTTPSDGDRDGVSLNETESGGMRERRDSGVGASLTRPNRLRWPSFQISNRLSHSMASLQITNQSGGQMCLLQKFSLLRLTAIMEKYSLSNKHGWTWSVPKFMKRMKVPDYKDKNVFGVPLIVHVQRTGQPLPLSLQQALRYLRSQCLDQVGLFRKSGVKSRIQALRQMNENSPDDVNYEDQSAYDVADMVKQFFRDLPEPLLTSKLGETFLHIYQYVPKDQRLQAVQAAIMLMSDENREVLQTLLCFLSDVTSSVEENQMTPMNIAVCLAPSLFHLNILKKDNLSPRAMQKKYSTGRPDQKDLNENLAATQGLAHMIMECNRLFEIPHEMVTQSRNSYVEADLHAPTMEEMFKSLEEDDGSYQTHMELRLQGLLKETREKAKGWVSCSSADNTELHYKKVGDGNPLRQWRVSVEVEAPPSVVLNRVLRERHLWDVDLLQWKVRDTLDKQTEVYQYVLNRMPPHPSRDFVVLRSWRTDLPKGTCSLVSVSVEHEDCPMLGMVRAVVLESNYLLEPCGSGKSRLTHICRVDLKGRTPEWYNKAFGHLCAAEAARIRNSFQPISADGPETKI
ncbi:stAR-related lipid transfer protein 13-like isoform X2 [Sardina pilchardus]|uniref:stAR-related lipid transfer protein 13-like isoform X2 n=1 Tax=Sardina pilchardus TaxID=27697 RepID=UPI002E129591